jgi:hypothetical protein
LRGLKKTANFPLFFILTANSACFTHHEILQIQTINVIKGVVEDRDERTLYGQLSLEMRDV